MEPGAARGGDPSASVRQAGIGFWFGTDGGLRTCFSCLAQVVGNQGRHFERVRRGAMHMPVLELVADQNGRGGYYGIRGDILA